MPHKHISTARRMMERRTKTSKMMMTTMRMRPGRVAVVAAGVDEAVGGVVVVGPLAAAQAAAGLVVRPTACLPQSTVA